LFCVTFIEFTDVAELIVHNSWGLLPETTIVLIHCGIEHNTFTSLYWTVCSHSSLLYVAVKQGSSYLGGEYFDI
jgi:hypothetical protein